MNRSIKSLLLTLSLGALVMPSCESALQDLQPVSAFPTVVCEAGGQRQIRVYGQGFEQGGLQVMFKDKVGEVTVIDPFTADVILPDITVEPQAYPWFPYNDHDEPGLYTSDGEAALWTVDVSRSKLATNGSPDFKTVEGERLPYRSVTVDSIVYAYDGGVPLAVDGPYTLGYFSTLEVRRDDAGAPLAGCGDGEDDYIGQFCYQPLYTTQGGSPLLYDAGAMAYDLFYAPWDPYFFKGDYYAETDTDYRVLYYDDAPGFADYHPGEVYNQSFGVFYSLTPNYVYLAGGGDPADPGAYIYSAIPLNDEGLTFIGLDLSQTGNEYFPYILPITNIDLTFIKGNERVPMSVPMNVVSREFDNSLLYKIYLGTPAYYDFDPDEYVAVDVDGDGSDDVVAPGDGSWGCVWRGYDCADFPDSPDCQ